MYIVCVGDTKDKKNFLIRKDSREGIKRIYCLRMTLYFLMKSSSQDERHLTPSFLYPTQIIYNNIYKQKTLFFWQNKNPQCSDSSLCSADKTRLLVIKDFVSNSKQ